MKMDVHCSSLKWWYHWSDPVGPSRAHVSFPVSSSYKIGALMNLQSSNFIMFLFSQTIAVSSFFHVFVPSFFPSFPMIFSIPQVLSAPNGPPTVPQRSPNGPPRVPSRDSNKGPHTCDPTGWVWRGYRPQAQVHHLVGVTVVKRG